MVYLSKIYTKSGDGGTTRLGDGSEVPKTHPRVEALGAVDELNAAIGVLDTQLSDEIQAHLRGIMNDLFDLGADLCLPGQEGLRITAAHVQRIESLIDQFNEQLAPLNSFVLPGGSSAAGSAHMARAICRRAERRVLALHEQEPVNEQALIYLNRLADLFFVLARHCNDDGQTDVLWEPGKHG